MTPAADLRRLFVLMVLTALAVALCERLSESDAPRASFRTKSTVTASGH
jgi:hypothetical protein